MTETRASPGTADHQTAADAVAHQGVWLRQFIQQAPLALAMFDRDMRYLAASARWLADYGLRDQTLPGKCHYDFFPGIPERWKQAHRRGLDGEVLGVEEDRFERLDGSTHWERGEIRPWYTGTGDVGGILIYSENITARKQAEQARAESEALFRATFDLAAVGIAHVAPDGRWLRVNPKFCEILGRSPQNLLSMRYQDMTHPDDLAADLAAQSALLSGAMETFETEKRYRREDGSSIWVQLSVSLARTPEGNPDCFIAVVLDIDARKQAEQALSDSEQRYRNLFTHSPDAILVERDECVVMANRACQRLYGADREEQLLGHSVYDLFRPDFHERIRDRIQRALRNGEALSPVEKVIRRLDGSGTAVEVVATAFPSRKGDAVHLILRDLSELKTLERQVIDAGTDEQERIGHEIHDGIGQQLTGLSLLAGGIRQRLSSAGLQAEADALNILSGHIQSALEEAKALARGLSPVDITPEGLVDALMALADRVNETSDLQCRYVGPRRMVLHDLAAVRHLYRIAQEAVQNAVRHAASPWVEIRLRESAGGLALGVADGGKGIDATQHRPGHLGLQIMRYRARIIGAALTIGSGPDGGTLVTCELPDKRPG